MVPSIHIDVLITEVSTEERDIDNVPSSRVINVKPSFVTVSALVLKIKLSSVLISVPNVPGKDNTVFKLMSSTLLNEVIDYVLHDQFNTANLICLHIITS